MLELYGHPFASYCWKVLIALYERDLRFDLRIVDPDHPENLETVGRLAPAGQFPVLVDGGRSVIESAAIIEYLDLHHGTAAPMVPADRRAAIEARQMDSVFDDYVMGPLQRMVFNALRPEGQRDPLVDAEARAVLTRSYAWLDRWMEGRSWAACDSFGLADCAAAPALHYAHWAWPVPAGHGALQAYMARLARRPSVARVVDEARPWRPWFPLAGTPPD